MLRNLRRFHHPPSSNSVLCRSRDDRAMASEVNWRSGRRGRAVTLPTRQASTILRIRPNTMRSCATLLNVKVYFKLFSCGELPQKMKKAANRGGLLA